MSNQDTQEDIYEMADMFIDMANNLLEDNRDLARVSAAFRFAAARFNAFEVTRDAVNLDEKIETGPTVEWFSDQYRTLFKNSIDEHIAMKRQGQ